MESVCKYLKGVKCFSVILLKRGFIMPRRKCLQSERQKVLCITAKKSVLRNHSFGQTSFICSSYEHYQ